MRPSNFVSIDPGDVHVGWAAWDQNIPWHLNEFTPSVALQKLAALAATDWLDFVVIESWLLRPDMAATFIGSDFPTCQMIGALKYILDTAKVPWVLQSPGIKEPTKGVLRNKNYRLVSDRLGMSDHVQDAELHGLHTMINGHKRFTLKTGIDLRKPAA